MKQIFILLFLWLPIQMMAQENETRSLDKFTEVSSSASINVTLMSGDSPKVDVSTDGELEDVLTEVSNGKLKISRKSNDQKFGVSFNNDKIEVTVYFQEIEKLKVSSSSKMEVNDPIQSKNLEIEVSSSGKLSLTAKVQSADVSVSSSGKLDANIESENLTAKVSSSGKFDLTGDTNRLEASVSSSGSIKGDEFNCSIANLSTSSSGKIYLNIEDELSAKASSSGKINYKGTPKLVAIKTSSGGKVNSIN
ncbi:DUF2807 domain-containing protein [Marivirga sp. S37H4]|uniref:DUF2807 domain-containing protein n=1 Tax=Marivirga aurantiaca TaxID=2802615 RepID=A0A934X0X8_9BACT|nr:head GIN domain-containing protein [Marivirga aurantiaca]MBK6266879.1 DUF2807 domain-containing protein [Marivirga aurantiaca]